MQFEAYLRQISGCPEPAQLDSGGLRADGHACYSGVVKNSTPAVKLILNEDGTLSTPFSAITDELTRRHFSECGMTNPFVPEDERGPDNPLLMTVYGAGDCDVAKWPLSTPELRERLARSLYDARETGCIPDITEVTLPDGSTFNIDMEVR